MSYWYLGSPYAKYPGGHQRAHDHIVAQASLLMLAGVKIFCPIAHSHNIAEHMSRYGIIISDPHRFWLDIDRPLMDAAIGLIICQLPGWKNSAGLAEEIKIFDQAHKPIVFMSPGVVPPGLISPPTIELALVHVSAAQLIETFNIWNLKNPNTPLVAYPFIWSNEIRQNPDLYPGIPWSWPTAPDEVEIKVVADNPPSQMLAIATIQKRAGG